METLCLGLVARGSSFGQKKEGYSLLNGLGTRTSENSVTSSTNGNPLFIKVEEPNGKVKI